MLSGCLLHRFAVLGFAALALAGCESDQSGPSQSSHSDAGSSTNSTAVVVADLPPQTMSDAPVVQRFTRPGGLILEDLKIGDGAMVLPGGVISFQHRGFLAATGRCYEDSTNNVEPIEVKFADLPKFMRDGIPGMRVGGLRRMRVPAELAFGEAGAPNEENTGYLIPPNSDIVYELTVVSVRQFLGDPKKTARPSGNDQMK